jgi:DnaJ-domain-containing protein 1
MIKRLFKIARAEFNHFSRKNKGEDTPLSEQAEFFDLRQEPESSNPLAEYYANLEIPVGSDRATIKQAWKTQMKKYHPDLHCADPEKKRIAEELTRQLNQAHRILDTVLLKKL